MTREGSTEEMFGQDREAFTRVAFGLAPGQTSEAFLLSDGYYVIQLATRMIPWDEFPGQESQFRQSLLTTKREQLISEWFKQVQQQAQIVDNTAAFFPSS